MLAAYLIFPVQDELEPPTRIFVFVIVVYGPPAPENFSIPSDDVAMRQFGFVRAGRLRGPAPPFSTCVPADKAIQNNPDLLVRRKRLARLLLDVFDMPVSRAIRYYSRSRLVPSQGER